MRHRSLPGLTAAILLALCSVGHLTAQTDGPGGPLAARLLSTRSAEWRSVARPHLILHVLKGTSADMDAQAIADSVATIRRELLRRLDLSASGDSIRPAHVFFVDSREAMRQLTGRPLMGFVQSGELTGVFAYIRGYNTGALLRHELTHLYTFQYWGAPRVGAWLVEGIAVWEGGLCQGHTPDELAAGARANRGFVPLTELARRFRELPEDVAMPEAGSIAGFLLRREGIRGIRDRWIRRNEGGAHPLGRGGPAVEAAWIAHISSVRPALLDIPRMLHRGC